jgi:hypothetical protein
MIVASFRKGGLARTFRWSDDRPRALAALGFTSYHLCRTTGRIPGFVRLRSATREIDLRQTEEQLLAGCCPKTIYEIKRARREGIAFELVQDPDEIVEGHNQFTTSEGARPITRASLDCYGDALVITKSVLVGETLALHSYIADRAAKRARNLHSISMLRQSSAPERRALNGRANRFLHFHGMLHFKEQGFIVYDLGGHAVDTDDPKLLAINRFKAEFGGELVAGCEYYSVPLRLYEQVKSWRRLHALTQKWL